MTISTCTLLKSHISAVVSCLPSAVTDNDVAAADFGEVGASVVKMTGVRSRHIAEASVTTSDLCAFAAERLFDRANIERASVDALIFVTQTPDYRLPATACHLQSRLDLRSGIAALDVNLGCSGYPYALWLAAMMIETGAANRVLLLVGDTISKLVDTSDRATSLLFGDCGTATLVDRSSSDTPMSYVLGSDGSGWDKLIVAEGGSRTGTQRPDDHDVQKLFMDGGEIFNFTLQAVPKMLEALCSEAKCTSDAFDQFLFHQANAFMINHLRKKMKLPVEKVPVNIGSFGNTSSASIPLLITSPPAESLKGQHVAMLGFGVGYSWAACSAHLDKLSIAETVLI